MKRISQKMLNEFINKVAIQKGDTYHSKIDGAYFTHVGLDKDFKLFLKKGIVEELQNMNNNPNGIVNIGYNPEEKKWYGWSHRAIYGFGIGSKCEKGHAHYNPKKGEWTAKTMEDAKQMAMDFAEGVS